jgi:hypothetical protein
MKKIPLILCVFAASCLFIGYVSWRTYQAGSAACAAVAAEVDKLNPWRCVPREGVTFVDVTNSSSSTNQTQGSVLTNISFDTPIVLKLDQEATFYRWGENYTKRNHRFTLFGRCGMYLGW